MNNQKQIEVIEDKIKELQKEVEKLKAKEWIPEIDEGYYFVGYTLEPVWHMRDSRYDDQIIKYNKVFKTIEEAQDYANYLKARKEYSYEFSAKEWDDDSISKYYIRYFYNTKNMQIDYNFNYVARDINKIYFKSKEKAEEFIKKYSKQILEYEFGVDV